MYYYDIYTDKEKFVLRNEVMIGSWEACLTAQAILPKDYKINTAVLTGCFPSDEFEEGLYYSNNNKKYQEAQK